MRLLLAALCLAGCATAPVRDERDAFFGSLVIPELRIDLQDREVAQLEQDPRSYVPATLTEGGAVHRGIGIKLKGAAGSFREIGDRPAITVHLSKFTKGRTLHGLTKFHLNNSVQDETCLNEFLASELLRAAGVPAPRVAHARLWLNGRDLGLYVLKEGVDATFLARHFPATAGNLYDGGFVQEIDVDLEKDGGTGPDDRSDLKALAAACREEDLDARWMAVEKRLDVDAFITFTAMELMMGHWDGYALNVNNYRVYFHPFDGRAHFLPHGMDQLFQDPGASIFEARSLVASTVMGRNAWRAAFRRGVQRLLPLFAVGRVSGIVDPVVARLRPMMPEGYDDAVRDLMARIAARVESMKEQLARPVPPLTEIDAKGVARLGPWQALSEGDDATIELAARDGREVMRFRAGPGGVCIASYRQRVHLPHGTYVFRALVRAEEVLSIRDEWGSGAGLRTSIEGRVNRVAGTTGWRELVCPIDVPGDSREMDLVIELRAKQGEAWFDRGSIRLIRE